VPIKEESPMPEYQALHDDMDIDEDDVPVRIESVTPPPLLFDNEMQSHSTPAQVQIRQESVTPLPLKFDDELPPAHLGK
jgi:hypothetical protein